MQYSFNTVEPTRILRFIIKTSLVNEFWSSINFVGLRTEEREGRTRLKIHRGRRRGRSCLGDVGPLQMKGGTKTWESRSKATPGKMWADSYEA